MRPELLLAWGLVLADPAGGSPPPDGIPTSVDLQNEAAVAARILVLEDQLAVSSTIATSSTATTRLRKELEALRSPAEFRRNLSEAEKSRREAERAEREAEARAAAAAAAQDEAERAEREARTRAQQARSELLQRLQAERAGLAAARADLAEARRMIAEARAEAAKTLLSASAEAQRLVQAVRLASTSSGAAVLFPRVDRAWRDATVALDAALSTSPPELPRLPSLEAFPVGTSTEAAALQADIEATRAEALGLRTDALSEEAQAQSAAVEGWRGLLLGLMSARSALWPEARPLAEGSWRDAWTWARLELEALRVGNLAWARSRLQDWQLALGKVSTRAFYELLRPGLFALLIGLGFFTLHLLIRSLRRRLREAELLVRNISWLRRIESIDRALDQFAPPLLLFAAAETVRLRLGGPDVPELVFLALVGRWVAVYWFVRNLLTQLVTWLARRGRRMISRPVRHRMAESIQLSARALVVAGLALELARFELGAGVLALLARVGVVFLLLGLAWTLLRRWRSSVADAYLRSFPEGRLARAVEANREKSLGVFVTSLAFLVVSLRTLMQLAQSALLSVEQIKRALAFIFKLRLERMREDAGPNVDIDALPPAIRKVCVNRPLKSDRLRVDRFPHETLCFERFERWKRDEVGASILLQGEKGCGKTTWLLRLQESLDISVQWLRPDGDDPTGLIAFIRTGGPPPDLEEPTLFFIDDLHRWLSRTAQGLAPYDRLTEWLGGAGHHHFLVTSCHGLFWRYLIAARPHRLPFDHELELGRWTEEEIRSLLMARAAGSGCVHEFDDLILDGDEREGAAARSGEAYIRLLWDNADGSPRVALHLWMESLVPVAERRVRVRLFRSLDTRGLSEERNDFLWMYSALVQHDGLVPEDAARVLRWPASRSWAALRHGEERAVLEQDESGRFRPTVAWERPLERLLWRRHMI
ncbi:MAG: hypothetical protein AAGD10_19040 [Myxococcota bacterium]